MAKFRRTIKPLFSGGQALVHAGCSDIRAACGVVPNAMRIESFVFVAGRNAVGEMAKR